MKQLLLAAAILAAIAVPVQADDWRLERIPAAAPPLPATQASPVQETCAVAAPVATVEVPCIPGVVCAP